MAMQYLKLPVNFKALFENLDDSQAGMLVKAMLELFETGEEPSFPTNSPMHFLWPMCRAAVVDSVDAYDRQVETNRKNGMKGGRPPKKKAEENVLDFAILDADDP